MYAYQVKNLLVTWAYTCNECSEVHRATPCYTKMISTYSGESTEGQKQSNAGALSWAASRARCRAEGTGRAQELWVASGGPEP